ncbi:MAG: hypothetical protein IJ009_00670 [Clostridia bacterium]|nr:hypothetical protein [Clostridia bacterium]
MQKTICKRLYDTAQAELQKKVTCGAYGDPAGYEESLFRTEDGYFFLYVNGGEASPYKGEDIRRMSEKRASEWLAQ